MENEVYYRVEQNITWGGIESCNTPSIGPIAINFLLYNDIVELKSYTFTYRGTLVQRLFLNTIFNPIPFAFVGRILNHDDSVNDRGPGSKLSTSDKTTRELWTNTFKSDFAKNGSMFRGDPPDLHIIPVPLDFSYKLATKVLIGPHDL